MIVKLEFENEPHLTKCEITFFFRKKKKFRESKVQLVQITQINRKFPPPHPGNLNVSMLRIPTSFFSKITTGFKLFQCISQVGGKVMIMRKSTLRVITKSREYLKCKNR